MNSHSRRTAPWIPALLTALALAVLAATGSLTAPAAQAALTAPKAASDITYTPSSTEIANPERGFYRHTGDCDANAFDVNTLKKYRAEENVTVVMCLFYLREFRNSAINQSTLDKLKQRLDAVRAAGLKTIVRFAYTSAADGLDAPKSQVLSHLDQLAPYLRDNSDVILLMQAGFVGGWGEWWSTNNFGDQGVISEADWVNRKAVTDKILAVLPSDRMVQLRTPKFKKKMYGASALPPGQAYDGSAPARLGHHNDCFLASETDQGTYENPAVDYPYLAAETNYLAMGGETCDWKPPRSDCPTALDELGRFHWSYLNDGYNKTVLDKWKANGCYPEISRKLGYRFVLQSGTYPSTARPGEPFAVGLTIRNDGYAAPFNPRGAELVLRDTSTGTIHRLPLNTDPRHWKPGQNTTVNQNLTLPANLPAGSYALLLNLPDPRLSARAEYSIRLANENTWNAGSGMNDLLHTVTVR